MEVPQVSRETGISHDYYNEYYEKLIWLKIKGYGIPTVSQYFRSHPVRKYEERFPSEQFENVVTDQNREAIRKLDQLADFANLTFSDESRISESDLSELDKKVRALIYGQD